MERRFLAACRHGDERHCLCALCVYNGELYAGGGFTTAGGVSANHIAEMERRFLAGPSARGMSIGSVYALCEYDDGLGPAPALYAGGYFTQAGGNVSAYIARWGCENALTDAASAKTAPDGRLVSITGDVSTAVFGDAFYVSHVNNGFQVIRDKSRDARARRDAGQADERHRPHQNHPRRREIHRRLVRNQRGIGIGQTRVHAAEEPWRRAGGIPVRSLGMAIVEDESGKLVRAWGPDSGLNNIGMLVRVCGKLTYIDANNFTLDDGSGIAVHCVTPTGVTVNPLWQYVAVTGISSCEREESNSTAECLSGQTDDMQVILP